IGRGAVGAVHDLSDGGLLVGIAEMALASGIGAEIAPPQGTPPLHAWLFGEDQARYLLTVREADAFLAAAAKAGVKAAIVGRTGGDGLTVHGERSISLAELRAAHEGWLPRYMAGGA
ncbi:MAG: phosphoribosylformylglycinamidine synthase II, partial [Alphaproteobacteria bacterium]|nr:phosphoribosylformylglycinamidine synthase II [Alphaproteobacteria bacterium]